MPDSASISINTSPLKLKDIMNPQTEQKPVENEVTEQKTEQVAQENVETEQMLKNVPTQALEQIENTEAKQKLIHTIQKYQDSSRFGKIVKYELGFKQNFVELSEKTESELENILHRIRSHLDNKNLDKFYENMATTLAISYEQILSPFYPIDGFSDMLLENEDFWNSYERFRIESEFPSVNPTTQMLFMIAQLTIIAHHTQPQDTDGEYEMQGPDKSLETIIEEIEPPTELKPPENDKVITDVEKPTFSLGQKL